MTYVLDNSQAKFSGHQRGLKRLLNLPRRLHIRHGVEMARAPGRWASRKAADFRLRSEIASYASREFELEGCLNLTEQIKAECQAAVARWAPRCDELLASKGEETPRTPWKTEELLDDDTIRNLIFHPRVVGSLAAYLGEAPVFSGVTLWIGQKDKKFAGSPFYHTDSCGWGNAKLYVYLSDVGPGYGEFTYVPRHLSERYIRETGYLGDALPDTDVQAYFKKDPAVALMGPKGSSFLIDTTKCLHFGSRCTTGHRYSIIISYQRWSAPNSDVGRGPAYLKSKNLVPSGPLARLLVEP